MSEQKIAGGTERSAAEGIDRRRSHRVLIRIGVTVHAEANGKTLALKVFTHDVNVHGALLTCPRSFVLGDKFELEHNGTRVRQSCRVVRNAKLVGGEFHVPIEFENAAPDFWKISFPPADWKPYEN